MTDEFQNTAIDRGDITALLSQVADSLRFYAAAGCRSQACDDKLVETVRRWSDPVTLAPAESLADIAAALRPCHACAASGISAGPLPGSGPPSAPLMMVAGAVFPEAAIAGDPLAGAAGELLGRIIGAMKLPAGSVYITHMVKCALADPRQPLPPAMVRVCAAFLEREIAVVAPKIICALGQTATAFLLETEAPLSDLRGRFHPRQGIKVLPTWHPADIITDKTRKRAVWEDVQKIMSALSKGA